MKSRVRNRIAAIVAWLMYAAIAGATLAADIDKAYNVRAIKNVASCSALNRAVVSAKK
ncbi:MAG: hypothetical protein R3E64_10430 [Halioglobus sp.]